MCSLECPVSIQDCLLEGFMARAVRLHSPSHDGCGGDQQQLLLVQRSSREGEGGQYRVTEGQIFKHFAAAHLRKGGQMQRAIKPVHTGCSIQHQLPECSAPGTGRSCTPQSRWLSWDGMMITRRWPEGSVKQGLAWVHMIEAVGLSHKAPHPVRSLEWAGAWQWTSLC